MKVYNYMGIGHLGRLALCIATLMVGGLVVLGQPKSAQACFSCYAAVSAADSYIWEEAEDEFDEHIEQEFYRLQRFIVHEMWEQSILPVMMMGAEQMSAIAMQQAMAVGMFFDTEVQLDTQRLLTEIKAQAHKDYHPSIGVCEFGSLMKSVAVTERKGEISAVALAQRSQDRQLGQAESAGTYGFDLDHAPRISQFREKFCNEKDRGGTLEGDKGSSFLYACTSTVEWSDAGFDAAARERTDKDIDYFSLIDAPWTVKMDFTNDVIEDTSPTPPIDNKDEEHILAMASNLYAHHTFPRVPGRLLMNHPTRMVAGTPVPGQKLTDMQEAYMDMRAIIAKRSVAENSFYAVAAMKAEGNRNVPSSTPPDTVPMNSRLFMEHILTELGVPSAEALDVLGENPSYFAQMEILTKKLYQNPDFYTNLYDKPVNVERKTVALQAIKLMQKFDMLKSVLRDEASTSILLELAVMDIQQSIEDQIGTLGVSDE